MIAPKGTNKRDPRPFYARVLRLKHIEPNSVLCFLFLEGTLGIGLFLALAEFTPWWIIPALVVAVAAMVKLNDLIAGAIAGPPFAAQPDEDSADDDLVPDLSDIDETPEEQPRDATEEPDLQQSESGENAPTAAPTGANEAGRTETSEGAAPEAVQPESRRGR
jgi:hypothetical protein